MVYDNKTRLLGLIGAKLGHSLSPLMQNKTLEKMALNYVYLPFEVKAEQVKNAVESIRALGIAGLNVTVPYKEAVLEYLDALDKSAADCGAVNVIHNVGGKLTGYNTDGAGFILALEDAGYGPVDCAMLIGGGGAARSLAISLAKWGTSEFVILEQDSARAENLAGLLKSRFRCSTVVSSSGQEYFDLLAGQVQMIINCSPAGMYPNIDGIPVGDLSAIEPGTLVCDLIYNPLETRFLSQARQRGLATMNGVAMLANQGALSLQIWCGTPAPRDFMQKVLESELNKTG